MKQKPKQPEGRRVGQFMVDGSLIREAAPEAKLLMSRIMPLRMEVLEGGYLIQYTAESDEFDLTEQWWAAPWYRPVFTRNPDSSFTLRFIRLVNSWQTQEEESLANGGRTVVLTNTQRDVLNGIAVEKGFLTWQAMLLGIANGDSVIQCPN